MGREIRRVPPDWEHPKDEDGNYQPLNDWTYWSAITSHIKELGWYVKHPKHISEWFECWPKRADYRPAWTETEATHYQMYENVTDGTPRSPVFAMLCELEDWLVEQGHSREAAERFCNSGYAPSFVITIDRGERSITPGIDYVGTH